MQFGLWKVLDGRSLNNRNIEMWECECSCGTVRYVNSKNLLQGISKSCGCAGTIKFIERLTKHKDCKSKEYAVWAGMLQRCSSPKHISYKWYGAKGISVCEEWKDYKTFIFDMGRCPQGHSIDRVDSTKGYSKENCKWSTALEQTENREVTIKVQYQGKELTFNELSKISGIKPYTLRNRVRNLKWSVEDAMLIQPTVGNNQATRGKLPAAPQTFNIVSGKPEETGVFA